MGNHPNRSARNRLVTFRIGQAGRLYPCPPGVSTDLTIHVTGVPPSITLATVYLKLNHVCWHKDGGGPWTVAWERVNDATRGAILKL